MRRIRLNWEFRMQHNVARVRSLLTVLVPMAAVMKENLHLIDKLLSEQEESCGPKAPRGGAELRRFGRGELSREIKDIAERVKIVSARTVIGELKALGVGVDQQRPESSVGNALRRLVRIGVLREINPGSGRRPATYQFLEQQLKLFLEQQ